MLVPVFVPLLSKCILISLYLLGTMVSTFMFIISFHICDDLEWQTLLIHFTGGPTEAVSKAIT